jgi:dihydrofolate reductase
VVQTAAVVRLIAAIDSKRGIATDGGIPWHLPGDVAYFRSSTLGGALLMGRATYSEFAAPLEGRSNFVLTTAQGELRPGFEPVRDLAAFVGSVGRDLWVIGGAAVFAEALGWAGELFLTQVEGDFGCTKFFPPYEGEFALGHRGEDREENGIRYHFEVWHRSA